MENELLEEYFSIFTASVTSECAVPSFDEFMHSYRMEWLDYCKTAIPQLLSDLTPALCAENATKYGWLTFEFAPFFTANLCRRALVYLNMLRQPQNASSGSTR